MFKELLARLYEKKWSNVACISRRERAMHAYLQRLAGF